MWNELLRARKTGVDPITGMTTRQITDMGTRKGNRLWQDIIGVKSVDRRA